MQTGRTTLDKAHRPRGQAGRPIRVMIVDDSLTVRTIFSRMVESDHAMEIAAIANTAEQALDILQKTAIDVVMLDLEMPGMGGLEALPQILRTSKKAQVLVVSSLTNDGAEHSLAALSMGAADTMPKPQFGGFNDGYRSNLLDKIKALGGTDQAIVEPPKREAPAQPKLRVKRPKVVAIGASTGGIHALNIILRALPQNFNLPIVITQHLPASFVPVFARQLEVVSARKTHVAGDRTPIKPGEIVIASGAGHMDVRGTGAELHTKLSNKPSRSGCLPSVDPMLDSLVEACDGRVLAVILSGMGTDGVTGAKTVVESGGMVIAQDARTSAVWGMPGAVAKANLASAILPPDKLADEIISCAGPSAWR